MKISIKMISADKVHVCKQLSIFFHKKFESHTNALFLKQIVVL